MRAPLSYAMSYQYLSVYCTPPMACSTRRSAKLIWSTLLPGNRARVVRLFTATATTSLRDFQRHELTEIKLSGHVDDVPPGTQDDGTRNASGRTEVARRAMAMQLLPDHSKLGSYSIAVCCGETAITLPPMFKRCGVSSTAQVPLIGPRTSTPDQYGNIRVNEHPVRIAAEQEPIESFASQ